MPFAYASAQTGKSTGHFFLKSGIASLMILRKSGDVGTGTFLITYTFVVINIHPSATTSKRYVVEDLLPLHPAENFFCC